jgi:hypothetical protein
VAVKRTPTSFDTKVAAIRRVRVGGESAAAVAESLGVDRRQLYRWEKEEGVLDAATAGKAQPAAPPAPPLKPPPVSTPSPKPQAPGPPPGPALLSEMELKKVMDGVRDGLRPDRALRLVGRKPSAWKLWLEHAEKGDPEARRVVEMITRSSADLERQLVLDIRKGGMGWQGAAWLLERLEPGTYTAEAAAEQGLGEQFSVDELVTIIREAGLAV